MKKRDELITKDKIDVTGIVHPSHMAAMSGNAKDKGKNQTFSWNLIDILGKIGLLKKS